ncbi:hypothetical protein BDQ17DRAFT_1377512, partial [Cyathus striatus]
MIILLAFLHQDAGTPKSSGCVCISTSLSYLRSKERKSGGRRFIYNSPSPSVVQNET